MGVRMRDLMKVSDHPEVKAAMDAHDRAIEVCREKFREWKDADRRVEWLDAELEAVVKSALERQDGVSVPGHTDDERPV